MGLECPISFFSAESLTLTKIDCLIISQRIKIIKTYYKKCDSATATYRALRGDYDVHNRLSTQAIGKIVTKFEETRVVTNIERLVYHRFARSAENIAVVSESMNMSITCRSQELGLSCDTLWRILHFDLHLHLYKVQLTQQLKPADHS